jgi:division protein 1
VWDLFTGTEIGRLQGHNGTVKCVQIENHLCLTGGEDGNVRLWDLQRVNEDSGKHRDDESTRSDNDGDNAEDGAKSGPEEMDGPCVRLLEGHSKAVTALYFEDECLVNYNVSISSIFQLNGCRPRSQVPRIRHFDSGILRLDSVS